MTKSFISIFIFSLLFSCSQSTKNSESKISYSKAQRQIQYLVDKFKADVQQEKDFNKQDSVRYKYAYNFYDLLSNIYIDSIRVHVDSVKIDHLTIIIKSHCNKEIAFESSLTFLPKMDSTQDLLFRFMKGLKSGMDTMVNFDYLGDHHIRLPNSNDTLIVKIFAYPSPIWLPKKG